MLSEKRVPQTETRKITKSVMEKKRRARINTSLTELKSILAGIIKHQGDRFDKMEKADILEMTVKYVRQLQKGITKESCQKSRDEDYKNGVNSCISEVIKYVATTDFCDNDVKTKLLDHLADRINGNVRNIASPVDDFANEPKTSEMSPDSTSRTAVVVDNNNNNTNLRPNLNTLVSSGSDVVSGVPVMTSSVPQQLSGLPVRPVPVAPDNIQPNPSMLQNIPLTILVPANFCSSQTNTTCLLAIPSGSPNQVQTLNPVGATSPTGHPTVLSQSPPQYHVNVIPNNNVVMVDNNSHPVNQISPRTDISQPDPNPVEQIPQPEVSSPPPPSSINKTTDNVDSFQHTFHKKYRRHLEVRKPVWRPW